jgi:hypothetical protein
VPLGGHYSHFRTQEKVWSSGFFWPEMHEDTKRYVVSSRLLSSRESIHPLSVYGELSLEHRLRFVLNGKMEHLTTHLHRPRTTRSPLSFWGDGGIVPFEPFFHAFPGGLEKAVINRTSLHAPNAKQPEILLKGMPCP